MKRPPKPRIVKPNLKWVWKQTQWVPFYRVTWTEGGKRRERAIKLNWQSDPEELDREYWRARGGRHDSQTQPAKYSWRTLITEWRSDPRVQGRLAASSKTSYRPTMEMILAKNADKDVRKTTRTGLRKIHTALQDTPRKADKYIGVVSLLWNYAERRLEWPMGRNPASGFDLYGAQRAFEPWPEWMVKALPDAPVSVQTAATLILNTGQRPGAAILMQFTDFRGPHMMVMDEKTDTLFEAFCPDDLQDYVRRLERKGKHLIAKNLIEPLGYNAVEKAFRAWRKALPPDAMNFSLHGLRKLAIVNLAEAGCSDAEIQAVTNQSAEMVAYYRKRASRKRLSASAHRRRGQNKNES